MSFGFVFLALVLITSTAVHVTNARPNPVKVDSAASVEVGGFFDGLALGSMKQSGGSSSGAGHKYSVSSQTLGGIKDSGPSPGAGHSYVTDTKN